MKLTKNFLILGLTAQFITTAMIQPAAAEGETKAPKPKLEWVDLTLKGENRVSSLFVSFERPGSVRSGVQLYGTVHKDCFDRGIRVQHHTSGAGCYGFSLQATPEAIACMQQRKSAGLGCDTHECKSLSQIPNTLLPVPATYTGRISVASSVQNADVNSPRATRCESFEPGLVYVSHADRRRQEIQEKRRRLQAIRNKSACVDQTKSLAEQLRRSGGMTQREFEQLSSRLAGLEFEGLKRRARRAKPSELTEVREALLSYASTHPDQAPKVIDEYRVIARRADRSDLASVRDDLAEIASEHGEEHSLRLAWVYRDIADRLVRGRNPSPEDYAEAEDTIADAQDNLELDERNTAQLVAYRGEIRNYHEAELQIQNMEQGQGLDQFAYSNYIGELYNNAVSACSGWEPSQHECQAATRVYQNAPGVFQAAYQKRVQLHQQLNSGTMQPGGLAGNSGPFGGTPFGNGQIQPGYGNGIGLPGQGQPHFGQRPVPMPLGGGIQGGYAPTMGAPHQAPATMGFMNAPTLNGNGFM